MSIKKIALSTALIMSSMAVAAFAGGPPPPAPEAGPGVIAAVYGVLAGCAIVWKSRRNK
jgi:hypothetical protein